MPTTNKNNKQVEAQMEIKTTQQWNRVKNEREQSLAEIENLVSTSSGLQ